MTGCYCYYYSRIIIVHPLAVIEVSDYELCDYTNPGDLIEVFDITTKSDEIINGQDVSTVLFYIIVRFSRTISISISNEELTNYSTQSQQKQYMLLWNKMKQDVLPMDHLILL